MAATNNILEKMGEAAYHILDEEPDPVVRFRLLRDVLRVSPDSAMLIRARQEMLTSKWVLELESEQRRDGSWGRFHSATKTKCRILTTEAAIERGLALGLEGSDQILRRVTSYLSALLEGSVGFPDPAERNSRWATGKQLFVAATLARICPASAVLDKTWELWAAIAQNTFASGKYDPEAEMHAHAVLTGASMKDSYLVLSGKYQLALLGSRAVKLPHALETALVDWVWHRKEGIRYLGIPLANPPSNHTAGMLDRLFTSLELLSYFPSWRRFADNMIGWLWKQRNSEGLWDLGPRANMSAYFPLSESWRKVKHRKHDWSTRVLALLRRFYDY